MSRPGGVAVPYDEAPLRPFHARGAVASFGGVFSDGFGLGIVGIALAQATTQLALEEYQQPAVDPSIREQLDAYVARRREAIGGGEP